MGAYINTENGEYDLLTNFFSRLTLRNSSGGRIRASAGREHLELITFTDSKDTYTYPTSYYLGQSKGKPAVSLAEQKNKKEFVAEDKFGNQKNFKVLEITVSFFAAVDVGSFIGKNLIVLTGNPNPKPVEPPVLKPVEPQY